MGIDIGLEQLSSPEAAQHLHRLRAAEPVAWVPAIGGWLVTGRAAAVEVLRDDARFTVDDERFSTGIVLGASMLSTDGAEHARHRAPFGEPFVASAVAANRGIDAAVTRIVAALAGCETADLRIDVAGPLAVAVIVDALSLGAVDHAEVLGWYRSIVECVERISAGLSVEEVTTRGLASLRNAIDRAAAAGSILGDASRSLSGAEVFANAAVVMFGAIETSEAMTANALWYLLTLPGLLDRVRGDRTLVPQLLEESLRLEPAAAVVDRYATRDTVVAGAPIRSGDLVRVSLAAANRDPAFFDDPDRFVLARPNVRQHLAFVQGSHVCLGLHMARAQTAAAINALLDAFPQVALEQADAPSGLLFRKPGRLVVRLA